MERACCAGWSHWIRCDGRSSRRRLRFSSRFPVPSSQFLTGSRSERTRQNAAAVGGRLKFLAGLFVALVAAAPAHAAAPQLQVGVGRADITPPTGYYMMGWVRSDGVIQGQHTRLWARVIVLRQGGRKVALVTEDLNGIPGGMLAQAADMDKDLGYSQENVLDSASHTHAAPTSFYNFST